MGSNKSDPIRNDRANNAQSAAGRPGSSITDLHSCRCRRRRIRADRPSDQHSASAGSAELAGPIAAVARLQRRQRPECDRDLPESLRSAMRRLQHAVGEFGEL